MNQIWKCGKCLEEFTIEQAEMQYEISNFDDDCCPFCGRDIENVDYKKKKQTIEDHLDNPM